MSFIEKQTIIRLFGISDGFVFKFWQNKDYNKTTTKELIWDSCGINIYEDEEYKPLSQQKCIEKIWNEKSPQSVAKLLLSLSQFFSFRMGNEYWSSEDEYDYRIVQEIIKRLQGEVSVSLPSKVDFSNIKILLEDIEANIQSGKPEMVLDRLHTFASEYFRFLCRGHGLVTVDDKGNEYPLHSLVGNLKKWYRDEDFFESEFCIVAIQNAINVFEKFNAIRNNKSAAHPNNILNKVESEYAVRIISDTLAFIDKSENLKNKPSETAKPDFLGLDDDLPF